MTAMCASYSLSSAKRVRWVQRGLMLFCLAGVSADYYVMHYYHAFDPTREGSRYLVDYSPIGRPRCLLYIKPASCFTNYSPWTPRNGDVVIARPVADYPTFVQLLSGRYVERETCGVELLKPEKQVLQHRAAVQATNSEIEQLLRRMPSGCEAEHNEACVAAAVDDKR